MKNISKILRETSHRPFPLPERKWQNYQEWQNVIFAHWRVNVSLLQKLVPEDLAIDLYNGEAWISLVAFTLKKFRHQFLPIIPGFHEINMRTYVVKNNKPGIYFLSREVQRSFPSILSRLLFGSGYYKSDIYHSNNLLESENREHLFYLKTRYNPGNMVLVKTDLDRWLTDRFVSYKELDDEIYSYEFHHEDWPLRIIDTDTFEINYRYGNLLISRKADLYHYSDGLLVPSWGKSQA